MSNMVKRWFSLIAEPRVQRVIQFFIDVLLAWGGALVFSEPPDKFQNVLGFGLTVGFGWFVFIGAVMAGVAVLPGIRWLERAGIVLLMTGVFIFEVLVCALGASAISFVFGGVLILTFVIRFLQIRKFALAPKLR